MYLIQKNIFMHFKPRVPQFAEDVWPRLDTVALNCITCYIAMSAPEALAFTALTSSHPNVHGEAPVVIDLDSSSSDGELKDEQEEVPSTFEPKDEQASPTQGLSDIEHIEYDCESSVVGSQHDGMDTARPPLHRLQPFSFDSLTQEPRNLRSFSGDEADVAAGPPHSPKSLFDDSGVSGIEGSGSEDSGDNGDLDEPDGNSDSDTPPPHDPSVLALVSPPNSFAPAIPMPSSNVGGIRGWLLRPSMSGGECSGSPGGEASRSSKCRRIDVSVSVSVSVTDSQV